jgi:hypothetical protein
MLDSMDKQEQNGFWQISYENLHGDTVSRNLRFVNERSYKGVRSTFLE